MDKEDPSDSVLIERYNSGDRSALPPLVRRWHKPFCEKAFWILRDRGLAKDVAQECWIIIIDKLPTLKNTKSFKSWAQRIVYTKAIDAHKRRVREMQGRSEVNKDVLIESDVEEDITDLKRQLLLAMQSLPVGKQHIVRLFYVEEYTVKEISSFLNIPTGTVKSRLFKAREKLKSIIKKEDHEK